MLKIFGRSDTGVQAVQRSSDALIRVSNVVKTYQSEAGSFTALKSVSLTATAGEFIAIVGKSGSGKSTLLNVLTGIDSPTSGELCIAGTAVHTLSQNQIAAWRGRTVGVVFQFFQLLPSLSIIENVMLPMDFCNTYPPRDRQPRAAELLALVGIAEQADKLPSSLSGGQQQRAAIARALANDPPILVADEPTGNLDSRTAEAVFALFEDLVGRGKTIIMVTHDHDLAARAGRIITIADGEIVDHPHTQAAANEVGGDRLPVFRSCPAPKARKP